MWEYYKTSDQLKHCTRGMNYQKYWFFFSTCVSIFRESYLSYLSLRRQQSMIFAIYDCIRLRCEKIARGKTNPKWFGFRQDF